MSAVENAFVQQTLKEEVVDAFDSGAMSVEPKDEKGETQGLSAVSPQVVREDGSEKARTQNVADMAFETDGASDEIQGPGIDPYIFAIIKKRITAAVRYPYLARKRGMEGTVLVEFFITEDGKPTDIDVSKSSGHRLLDEEAERTIKRASPYPSLKEKIEVPVRFMLTEDRKRWRTGETH